MDNDEIIVKHMEKFSHYNKLSDAEQLDRIHILMDKARADEREKFKKDGTLNRKQVLFRLQTERHITATAIFAELDKERGLEWLNANTNDKWFNSGYVQAISDVKALIKSKFLKGDEK